ncbi:pickpocket protein 28-like isoform X2 [Anthonomus grandis grandis]|uniref:pickpocket protein 28-like isoform X2 n=1 Tax=Anthonomus grandis grandis TaxID=2921223 RepID=UPI0021650CEB|nr:pickpocket protein 28-like isoform X2 [Anthonomus grandis grandis]
MSIAPEEKTIPLEQIRYSDSEMGATELKHRHPDQNSQPADPVAKYASIFKRNKRPYPGFRKNFYKYFAEYSNNTGIHGFKYMGDPNMTVAERLWWFALFCVSLYICINLIIQTYIKWDTAPVLVSFARSPTPVWQVPFPAITVCSETKARQRAYNFTEYYHRMQSAENNMTEDELKKFADLALVCESHLFNKGKKTTNYDTIEFLMGIAPQFDEMLWSCKHNLINGSCADFFTPILTEEGLCYTFNMLDRSELLKENVYTHGDYMSHDKKSDGWNLENGYPPGASLETYPRRALSAGFNSGFLLLLRAYETDLDFICRGPVQGFKILLHNPAETPRVSLQYFRAPLNQEVVVAIKPDMMTTSENLKSYEPHMRQCYFPTERNLAFFQTYTQQNCEIECLTNYTLKKCGCVSYYMPHEKGTPICGSGNIICAFHANEELRQRAVELSMHRYENYAASSVKDVPSSDCDCLPGCMSLVYNAETSQADFMWPDLFDAFKANKSEFPNVALTRITIFFKEQQFITSERNELYGRVDFLANCGGILGLFTGFSFLSIVEVLYFLSLKLICNVRKFGVHNWSG